MQPKQDYGWSPWLCARALALRRSRRSNQCPPAAWRQKESLAEIFVGVVIECPRAGSAEDEGCGVPGHRAAVALAHRHICWPMSARDNQVDDTKHDLPAGDLSALHLPVTHTSTRE